MFKVGKKSILRILSIIPILSISFAAQAALLTEDSDVLKLDKKFLGKSLFIDEMEYNLQSILNSSSRRDEYIGNISVEFIKKYKNEILEGEIEGMEIKEKIIVATNACM